MTTEQLRDLHAKCVEYAVKGRILPPNMTIVVDKKYMIENETFWLVSFDGTNTFGKVDKNFDPSHESGIIQFAKAVGLYEEPHPEPKQPQGLYPVGTIANSGDTVMIVDDGGAPEGGWEIGTIYYALNGESSFKDDDGRRITLWAWEYVIIAEKYPNLPHKTIKPSDNKPHHKAIDPVLLQLTCAALSGMISNSSDGFLTWDEYGEQSVGIAKATLDELRKISE